MKSSDINLAALAEQLLIDKRDYQIAAVQEILNYFPDYNVVLNYPYGTGKTIIALLTFLAFKEIEPEAKFIFTSAREAAALRCKQALEMAKKFGFLEKLGYLYEPKSKGLSLHQKTKMYKAANVIFAPITLLSNDRFQIKSKLHVDIFEGIRLVVVDESTDLLARDLAGFRLSKYFDNLFKLKTKWDFAILALTGSKDPNRIKAITRVLGHKTALIQRLDLKPYETISQTVEIKREDYTKLDRAISDLMTKPIEVVQDQLGKEVSRVEVVKLAYGGALERLKGSLPIHFNKITIDTEEQREQLYRAFSTLFKLAHARLLLLESTPGEFMRYVEMPENKELFKKLGGVNQLLTSYRTEFPLFSDPTQKIVRALLNPKVEVAIQLICEHLIKGAKVLVFTRYVALGEQLFRLLNKLQFPNVSLLTGKTPEETRRNIINKFQNGDTNVLVFTPIGGRGLNLDAADVVIHLDITTNIDDMVQRRERARGCMEYVLVLKETSEANKVKEYQELLNKQNKV